MSQWCITAGDRGEAVVLPLPSGKILFVVRAGNARYMVMSIFAATIFDSETAEMRETARFYLALERLRLSILVPRNEYPLFVYFENIDDPASIVEVNPDDLAASFGTGYALKSLSIQITNERETRGAVKAVLPWLDDIISRIKPTNKRYVSELSPVELLKVTDFRKK